MTSKYAWITGLAAALSVMACYGTLTIIAALGALGVTVALDETIWGGTIVAFAGVAVCGLAVGFSRHRQIWPILAGGLGAAVLGYAFYFQYAHLTEFCGFALLSVATL